MMIRQRLSQAILVIEAGVTGLFLIQALRFVIGMIYSRVAGASVSAALALVDGSSGVVDPRALDMVAFEQELLSLAIAALLPLFTALFARGRWLIGLMVLLAAGGRALMGVESGITPLSAAGLTVFAGLSYLALTARHRARLFPSVVLLGLGLDQLLRAAGDTVDPSLSPAYGEIQIGVSIALVIISLIGLRVDGAAGLRERGGIPFWGALGMGALLFLQLSLFGLPNAIAGRAGTDYTTLVPLVIAATWLPLVPLVGQGLRGFISLFDSGGRGWVWMLVTVLLVVFGTRVGGLVAGVALTLAAFTTAALWWWIVKPADQKARGSGAIWLYVTLIVLGLLVIGDNFTYEYAFVRDFSGDLDFLNRGLTPLLRGFRGLGFALILVAVVLAALPMTLIQRRIPWGMRLEGNRGAAIANPVMLLIVIAGVGGAAYLSRPPIATLVLSDDEVRIGTYNLHAGFDEFHNDSLTQIAQTIAVSGANVILLQEVDAGRLGSFGVDQSLWLARRLGMDRRFFATNEGLSGLAILSNMQIAFDDAALLASVGSQTGVQRAQILPTADPSSVVTIYNTWLSPLVSIGSETIDDQAQDQQRQLSEIFSRYIQQPCSPAIGRTVVGGTFHNVPDSPLVGQMRAAGFVDPFAGLPLELSATFVRVGLPNARFDYLWTCNLVSLGAGVMDSNASDHRMAVSAVGLNLPTP